MPWQLRAIGGPLEGAVYRLRRRVTLGRAGDCDIQIINEGVSRQHAKVVAEADGHVLVDLASNNGTFVEGAAIERHVLQGGDVFRIVGSRFVYEPVPEGEADGDVSGVWALKVTDTATLRQTVDQLALPRRRLTPPVSTPAAPEPEAPSREPARHRIVALRHDGSAYRGDLVGDILSYRDLQRRMIRGDTLAPVEQQLLRRFEREFRQADGDASPFAPLRRHGRFRCRFPARVRWHHDGETHSDSVMVQDLGVGGARLTWPGHALEAGRLAWLVIDVASGQRCRTLVFGTRVAWSSAAELGLQFAGPVEWERPPA